jgi:hypothetical protein
VPPLDPVRYPSLMVYGRKPCRQAMSVEGAAARTTQTVTTRFDRCRHADTCQQFSSAHCSAALPHAGGPAVLDPLTPAVGTTAERGAGQLAAWHRMCCREGSQPCSTGKSRLMSVASCGLRRLFGHPAWRFDAPFLDIAANEQVSVRNHGGEDHRFTEVDEKFGGGRVAAFNAALGLPARPDCAADAAPPIHPGEHTEVKGLSQGTHYFMCCIHPWMHAVIEVSPHE